MIAGLKLRGRDAEQPLLGPRMLSMRVNVLKCEKKASETASVLIYLGTSESLT